MEPLCLFEINNQCAYACNDYFRPKPINSMKHVRIIVMADNPTPLHPLISPDKSASGSNRLTMNAA